MKEKLTERNMWVRNTLSLVITCHQRTKKLNIYIQNK